MNLGSIISKGNIEIVAGGIVGLCRGTATLCGCENSGNIEDKYISSPINYSKCGGIIGLSKGLISIIDCHNYGEISSNLRGSWDGGGVLINCIGGIIGECAKNENIQNCSNAGNINGKNYFSGDENYIGGIVGRSLGNIITDKLSIIQCYNSANIDSSAAYVHSGGIIGRSDDDAYFYGKQVQILNSYNSGNIIHNGSYEYYGGIEGSHYVQHDIVDCYSSGGVTNDDNYVNYSKSNCYHLKSYGDAGKNTLSELEMRSQSSYSSWNFDLIWNMNDEINTGYPYLIENDKHLLNISNKHLCVGESVDLKVCNIPDSCEIQKWFVSYGSSVSVDSRGKVTCVNKGLSTVTAIDNNGHKINCNIVGMVGNDSADAKDTVIPVTRGYQLPINLNDTMDYIVSTDVSDNNVLYASPYANNKVYITPRKSGTATIRFYTAQGVTGSCTVTVTNIAEKIDVPSSETVSRGTSKQLTLTTTPSPTSSNVTWSSSDESIATVDENGVVTGIAKGTVTVKAQTDNGLYDTCTVTVNAPVVSLQFEKNEMAIYKGDTEQLNLVKDPADTSDSISYSSSYSSVATVSSSGLITAKAAGTATITATASSGIKTTCKVKVLDYPTIVTGVTLDKTEYDLKTGEMFQLKATVTPNNATNPAITWASTDETVATVNKDGRVTAVGAGKSLITAESENGIIAYCTVNVTGVASTNISKIYVPQILATDEEYVDVPVMIENNPGINFASIKILYDNSNMEAQSITNGTVFDSVMGSIEDSCVKLYFTSSGDKSSDGVLAMIRFKVQRVQQEQSYLLEVCYYPGEIRNENSSSVAFNLSDGKLGVPACSHKSTEIEGVLESTCTSNGYTGDEVCINCNYVVKTGEVVSMKQHSWKFVTDREATYGTVGQKSLHCSVCGTRQEGSEIEIPKLICSLSAPKTVTAQLYGYDDIIVSWSKVEGASGYAVYYKNSSETKYSLIRTVSTSIKRANLSDGVEYTIKVIPYIKENGEYYNSNNNRITSLYTLKKLTTPKVAKVSASYVKVSWKNISGESGYQIARSKYSNKNYSIVKTVSYKYSSAKIKTVKKKTYYYKVRAYKTVNGKKIYGPWSSVKKYKLR